MSGMIIGHPQDSNNDKLTLQQIQIIAMDKARRLGHRRLTGEHYLFAMLHDRYTRGIFELGMVNIQNVFSDIEEFFKENKEILSAPEPNASHGLMHLDEQLVRIFDTAKANKNSDPRYEHFPLTKEDILYAMYAEDNTTVKDIVEAYLPFDDFIQALEMYSTPQSPLYDQLADKIAEMNAQKITIKSTNTPSKEIEVKKPVSVIDKNKVRHRATPPLGKNLQEFCRDISALAHNGKIDPIIGRTNEIQRVMEVFSRRTKSNPLLIGDPGVGKTAIAEGFALQIATGNVPEELENDYVLELDLGALTAGTTFRGQFEQRMKDVLKEIGQFETALAKKYPNAPQKPRVRLFIDEIHMILGAGAGSNSTMDAANLMKPALSKGEISCIGATTYAEFRQHLEKDKALVRRFQKVDIYEPTVEETAEILKGLSSVFEAHHGITYTNEAMEAAAKLAKRYIHHRHLPDSAIDVIDEAAASEKIKPKDQRVLTIDVAQIEASLAKIARIPQKNISSDDMAVLETIEDDLKKVVFGQDSAIEELASAIQLSRAGLRDPEKPIGNYLFTGPTGVGKTEVCKQLANVLGVELLRFDMSEYMEKHAVSRLVGAPPGYIGFDQGGLLTDAVDHHPYSVLLLDEIEKAHPDTFNLLLQIMDHGKLTDTNGKTVDFRNVILIMTSNAGAADKQKQAIGFGSTKNDDADVQAVNRTFAPEFRNRLDAVIGFNALGQDLTVKVAEKFIAEMQTQLQERNVNMTLDGGALSWLAQKGHDPLMGARPMGRVIQEFLKKPISKEILFGKLKEGGTVRVTFSEAAARDNKQGAPLKIDFNAVSAPKDAQEVASMPVTDHKPNLG